MKPFQRVRIKKPQTAVFDLSHERKMTINMADLVPMYLTEIIPGDRFKVDLEALVRFQPLLAPIMHRVHVYAHWYFVPNRLVWDEWEDFITGGRLGTLNPNHPKLTGTLAQANTSLGIGTIADYLGLPSQRYVSSGNPMQPVSQLPFRAYQMIFNEYYRDQNLLADIDIPTGSTNYTLGSPTANILVTMRKRAWEKDYFTSCLPWTQRGAQVQIPIAGTAPVTGVPRWRQFGGTWFDQKRNLQHSDEGYSISSAADDKTAEIGSGLHANLEAATNTTITDLRRAHALQRWLEKNARAGSRYIEQILMHFGVKSPDQRLQRPEFLGGGKMPVQISEVLQTSETDGTPQGTMSGHGISAGRTRGFTRYFTEHGYVMGILSVIPRTAYQDGVHRHWCKFDRYDYFFPEFAHIGEQAVKDYELFQDDNAGGSEGTFGYQERYAEYRYMPDTVHGDMRTNLDFWHLGRKFVSKPILNNSFVTANPSDRIYPVVSPQFKKIIIQAYANIKARRPIPKYGDPI